jgi:hypothetical protein
MNTDITITKRTDPHLGTYYVTWRFFSHYQLIAINTSRERALEHLDAMVQRLSHA